MARVATKKQRKFAKTYVETGNGTQSALAHYNTKDPDVAGVIASENLGKPKVRELIDGYAARATTNIQTLAETAENESVRLNANKDQLDRAGYKPVERTMSVSVEVEAPKEIRELAQKLNALYRGSGKPSDGIITGVVGDKAQDKE
jgi:phage terminase small subunit